MCIRDSNIADKVTCEELKVLWGRDYYMEKILGLDFKVSAFSFFQTNVEAVERLYSEEMCIRDSTSTARILGMSEEQIRQIYYGALLHDLGKIGIPVEILEFPGKLSPQAMNIMRTHVNITEEILGGTIDPAITKIAIRHHEKLDGSGYPRGLKANELTLERCV